MTPASNPTPDGSVPVTPELTDGARNFRLRMAVIDRESEVALDLTCDRYGRTVHSDAAAAARAHRNRAAVEAYTTHLAPHADTLLDAARRALDELPPARHLAGWRAVLDGLAASAAEIRRALDRPVAPGSPAERAQHSALWPHVVAWADHSFIASDLADQNKHHHHKAPLTDEEQQMWTERALVAQRRGELELSESWYAADGQPITLAHLIEDDDSTLVALRGDPDAPGWQVIGHYAHEYQAGKVLPVPVPPGVLRADVSWFNRPAPVPEVSLQELIRDVVEGQTAGDASEALLGAVQRGYDAGPMVRLQELLETSGQFASALETVQGRQIAARLSALGRQIDFLTREVEEAAEDLGATVAVLPPHRTPVLRVRPRPAVDTAPPTPPARTSTTARHR
ncbi:hypothetical protein GCM10018777_12330 [Streptomyces albogriseolus]|uniref:hypothetical protein n=1 Tax=Streptomyces albogriseolus TaxID=1887 RepID=UPI001679B9B2|nr:hypothetical protein [Streptomyces viridodiastaticus]MCX4570543.1 hypothetical protein [Streptomyces viridodiastaticus]GHG02872.1 hypothetical protein GCM10018777_12330 [Streptomyces viridodiastaticus]